MKIGSVAVVLFSALAFVPSASYAENRQADTRQDDGACVSDAMSICSEFIPDRSRVAGCLMSNRSRISPSCRAQLAHWKG
jgi:hypothetical protein